MPKNQSKQKLTSQPDQPLEDTTTSSEDESSAAKIHPIDQAIVTFLDNVRDIETLLVNYVPLAYQRRLKLFKQIERDIKKNVKYLNVEGEGSKVIIMTRLLDALTRLDRISASKAPQTLESSLFLGMFSAYDVFTGDLLTAIYGKKPELFKTVNREIAVSEILSYDSFNDLKATVLQTEIESFRRKSYIEQFEDLETKFGLPLKAFDRWPEFVECSQRRNLMTHCGGVVSEQYLNVCSKEGYSFDAPVRIGEKLELGGKYFLSSCELMMEVGFKLGQTLWRKVFPDEMETADGHMIGIIYDDCLRMERWDRAVIFSEFAVNQKRLSSDVYEKICIINYAIGLKFGGRVEDAKKALSDVDWSGAAADFKLAEAVLNDRYDEAAETMKRIGKEGEYVQESFYHQWPLFHEFRKSEPFLEAYEVLYGHPFAVELQRAATKAQAASKEELEREKVESPTNAIGSDSKGEVASPSDDAPGPNKRAKVVVKSIKLLAK